MSIRSDYPARWEGITLSDDEWQRIFAACTGNQWFPLLERIKTDSNKPVDLETLDKMLRFISDKHNYPAWEIAIPTFNARLVVAQLPYRIKKVREGKNCNTGYIQIHRVWIEQSIHFLYISLATFLLGCILYARALYMNWTGTPRKVRPAADAQNATNHAFIETSIFAHL